MLPASSGWSTSERYTFALGMLNALLTRVISSFGGTTAIVPCWLARALSSLSACDPEVPAVALASGAGNGVHPFAGSRKAASSLSSLPLTRVVAPAIAAALAVVFCAVWALPLIRYVVITLSLWSWSIVPKLRVVRHGWPSREVPTGGTVRVPPAISELARL